MLKHRIKAVFWFLLSAAAMTAIFLFSAQDADASKSLSNGLLARFYTFLSAFPEWLGLLDGGLIRKWAHFAEFMCLGFSTSMFFDEVFIFSAQRTGKGIHASLITGFLYACSDEFHQLFVPGRAFQFRDILIDFAGVLSACLTAQLVLLILSKLHRGSHR